MADQPNLYGITNLEMEKRRFLEIDMDPSSLVCVNPHEVTSQKPIADTSKQIPTVVPQNTAATNGGGFYEPQRKIKLEMDMEVFSDLSPFVYPKPMLINSVDELNTPLFDKDIFDFGIHSNKCYQPNEVFVKLEHGYYENTYTFDNSKFKDNFIHSRDNHTDTGQTYRHGSTSSETSTNNLQNSATSVILPEADDNINNSEISPAHITTYNVDDQSALSIGCNEIYSNVSSPEEQMQYIHSGLVTPPKEMNSNALKNRSPNLTLNVNLRVPSNIIDLATPSIIDSVVDLEAEDFDILNIVGDEDVISNPEEILNLSTTIPPNSFTIQNQKVLITEKKPRKRWKRGNDDDDDDADYVPPQKRKNVQYRKAVIEHLSETDSDSDSIDIQPITRPRGRPPKRTGSVSSECSKDSDTSKYRELRDKNNEASRRSRHKRKMKELEMEKEADKLMSNNIKLKAQVEELEKMVTNFRENLFKIMIRK